MNIMNKIEKNFIQQNKKISKKTIYTGIFRLVNSREGILFQCDQRVQTK